MANPSLRSIRTAHVRLVPLYTDRPSLLDLWTRYRFQARTLAQMADVSESIVLAMFYNQPVHRADAKKVLMHLSMLLHKVYTLSTVAVVLTMSLEGQEKQADEVDQAQHARDMLLGRS